MTKKQKLETFDAVAAERDILRLAVYDLLAGASKFPFRGRVTVDVERDVDGNYQDHMYRISVSERAMPYYMVECLVYDGQVASVAFHTSNEIEDHVSDYGIYWRALGHGIWKLHRKIGQAAQFCEK